MTTISQLLNDLLQNRSPSQVILITLAGTLGAKLAYYALSEGRLSSRAYKVLWRVIRTAAAPIINREIAKAADGIKMPAKAGEYKAVELPEKGMDAEAVIELVSVIHADLDIPYEEGGFSGTVYHGGREHTQFINRVMEVFQWSNPLHSDIFGATRKMEAEVISMVVHMFNGHLVGACGAMTSGGTESIMMAMKTYRDWGRVSRGIERPSIVLPITAHPAFDKAALYFDLSLIKVPVDPKTMRVVPSELEKYIRFDTVAIVGSAPTFPHGAVDPIAELAEIAVKHNIGMHVDACLGGFIMPFIEKTGRTAPVVDFRNRGVTSISCDTHKYGYAPKGTSTVLYRSKELRAFQFCCVAEWPGGIYCSPAVSGSKPGNVIAGTWAAMVHLGYSGYVECCDKIMSAREAITDELSGIPYLKIIGEPTASVFAFNSDLIDIFQLGDGLGKRGWVPNRLQFPSGLQFSVTLLQTNPGVAKRFVRDVREIGDGLMLEREKALSEGKVIGVGDSSATMYGSVQRIPDRSIVQDVLVQFLNKYYSTDH